MENEFIQTKLPDNKYVYNYLSLFILRQTMKTIDLIFDILWQNIIGIFELRKFVTN